jgi:hypothetical protein
VSGSPALKRWATIGRTSGANCKVRVQVEIKSSQSQSKSQSPKSKSKPKIKVKVKVQSQSKSSTSLEAGAGVGAFLSFDGGSLGVEPVGELAGEFDEGADGDAAGTFGDPRLVGFHPGCPGDIEMDPGSVFDEFLEEHCCGHGAAPASAGVHDVGDGGLDHLGVFGIDGHAPHFFAGALEGLGESVEEILVVAEDSDVGVAESDDDGPGKRGGVDEMSGTELARVVESVGEDETALGVGVDDLDGLAVHGELNVARLLRFAAGHIF